MHTQQAPTFPSDNTCCEVSLFHKVARSLCKQQVAFDAWEARSSMVNIKFSNFAAVRYPRGVPPLAQLPSEQLLSVAADRPDLPPSILEEHCRRSKVPVEQLFHLYLLAASVQKVQQNEKAQLLKCIDNQNFPARGARAPSP